MPDPLNPLAKQHCFGLTRAVRLLKSPSYQKQAGKDTHILLFYWVNNQTEIK